MQEQQTIENIEGLIDKPTAVFGLSTNVGEVIDQLRELVKSQFVTYGFIVDENQLLKGVVVMRDLLFNERSTPITSVMISDPFYLTSSTSILDAMKESIKRHYPLYPVCDQDGRLIGELRGYKLFEAQAVELSAQAGSMVGVEKEERLITPWQQSFKYRHPWLQLNLITAFTAGAVVSIFQGTIDKFVILASFLPVLAGQSGNTGCQSLAVTLRGLTLGDFENTEKKKVLSKEAFLGLLNGFFVGLVAAGAMYFLAKSQGSEDAGILSAIVLVAMVASCVVSGLSGALVPLILKRLGADPATASSIFLTTATDVASMGLLLGLASILL
jgi:magnesium transporter